MSSHITMTQAVQIKKRIAEEDMSLAEIAAFHKTSIERVCGIAGIKVPSGAKTVNQETKPKKAPVKKKAAEEFWEE